MRNSPAILIDATDIHRPSGVRTAVYELLRQVVQQAPAWRFVMMLSAKEPGLCYANVRQIVIPVRWRPLERICVQAIVAAAAFTRSVDLVHFARSLGGVAWPVPSILTIFDLTTVIHPELHGRSARWYWERIMPLHLRSATTAIAISQNVREDLVNYYGTAREKIHVIYCAPQSLFDAPVDPMAVKSLQRELGLPQTYLLFVGMLARKKNLATLISAVALLKDRGIEAPLVIVGRRYSQSDDTAVLDLVKRRGLDALVRYLGPVSQDDLRGLYAGARMLVYPSLHEGFGLPCVEAMKCGVPVVAARSGAIPEIVGDAAVLIDDPTDSVAFSRAIEQLLVDEDARQGLIALGYARAAAFSWKTAARDTVQLYDSVMHF